MTDTPDRASRKHPLQTTPQSEPVYLGDGLYALYDGWQIELFASNGLTKTNRVFLEPAVLQAFLSFARPIVEARRK